MRFGAGERFCFAEEEVFLGVVPELRSWDRRKRKPSAVFVRPQFCFCLGP
jgi:hypothetical protein